MIFRRTFVSARILNLPKTLKRIEPKLKPPVSNKLLFDGSHLKIMIVGGPNQRDDFHFEAGEELFIQLKGNMEIHTITHNDMREKIEVKENEFYVLPSQKSHSPQRFENTLGLVFERTRLESEVLDYLVWYESDSNGVHKVAYQDKFFCTDLGYQIAESIERFNLTDTYKSKILNKRYPVVNPFTSYISEIGEVAPFSISKYFQSNLHFIENGQVDVITLSNSEFVSKLLISKNALNPYNLVNLFQDFDKIGEVFIWQIQGTSILNLGSTGGLEEKLKTGDASLLPMELFKTAFTNQTNDGHVSIDFTNSDQLSVVMVVSNRVVPPMDTEENY
jgi:3-hydroxyanthranilate 3,4-dioxygenase